MRGAGVISAGSRRTVNNVKSQRGPSPSESRSRFPRACRIGACLYIMRRGRVEMVCARHPSEKRGRPFSSEKPEHGGGNIHLTDSLVHPARLYAGPEHEDTTRYWSTAPGHCPEMNPVISHEDENRIAEIGAGRFLVEKVTTAQSA